MSFTARTSLGVGFKVEESDLIDFFGQEKFEEFGAYDLLDTYLEDYPLLGWTTGGNAMHGEIDYVIAVHRLRRGFKSYEPPYGVFGLDKPVIALGERIQLLDVAAELLGREPNIGQFVAIYVG